jgi:predicted RNase H-like nuclease (RuvC/YqgF family)
MSPLVEIEYTLTHAAECTERLNRAERDVAGLRPELIEAKRELIMAEETLQQARREKLEAESRHRIEVETLQAELRLARRPFLKRVFS